MGSYFAYGSVCSGIEAATTAWHPLGWIPAWFAEIEPFPSAVLAHHWSQVPNLGDFTAIRGDIAAGTVEAPDVLVGGTPCQAFSVAGLRQSMDDARGQLTLEFVRLANAIDATRSLLGIPECIVVWENVPGVLNTPDNAFGCFLAGLAGEDDPLLPPGGRWTNAGRVLGPSRAIAWRILDAQHFGVAQRRRRVFVVASARKGFDPATVLFEWDGVRRDSPPSREAGKGSSPDAARRSGERSHWDGGPHPTLQAGGKAAGSATQQDAENGAFVTVGFNARQDPDSWEGRTGPLDTDGGTQAVAFGVSEQPDTAHCLRSGASKADKHESTTYLAQGMQVRRLTPTECERLQGFPDGHTRIPWRGKPSEDCPDGPRYKALGNSMAAPVMRWIGARIARELEVC